MHFRQVFLATVLMLAGSVATAAPLDAGAVEGFVDDMTAAHGFDRAALLKLFGQSQMSESIIDLMTRPAEKVKPWWEYRALFISDRRIRDGAAFWREHAATLERAEQQYGVLPEVIVAIIGVETSYGRITGGHRVIDALSTLAFHYPGGNEKRSRFFRAQLEHFLLFCREEKLDPLALTGSYAGAMGMPQFMPENYRKLAVDYNDDGQRDIWTDADDAVGSVANYLAHHGWQRGGPVVVPASVDNADLKPLLKDDIRPQFDLAGLAAAGVTPMVPHANPAAAAALFELQAQQGKEYWLGYTNFYVISRYNPRVKYAMAVAHLADAIRELYDESSP